MSVFLLPILFLSLNSFATVKCDSSKGNFSVDLKNDQTGSMRNLRSQDQDGLGTCYANSLSVMLESWTGAPVSYHQIATAQGLDQFFLSQATNKEGQYFTEGGFSCEAFEALRKRDKKLCHRKDVLFENLINSENQEVYLKKIGEFYDALHELDSSEARKIIGLIKSASKEAKKERMQECEDSEKLQSEAEEAVGELAEKVFWGFLNTYNLYKSFFNESQMTREVAEQLEAYRKQAAFIGELKGAEGVETFEISSKVREKIKGILLDLKTQLYSLNSAQEKKKFLDDIILQLLGEESPFKEEFRSVLNAADYKDDEESFNTSVMDPILSYSNPDYCLSKEQRRLFHLNLDMELECSEGINPKIEELLGQVSAVLSDNYGDLSYGDGFFDHLGKANKDRETFFMGLINKSCEESGITIPKDAQCHYLSLPERIGVVDSVFKSKDEIEKEEKEKTLYTLNSLASQHLQADIKGSQMKGRALVVDVCSGFLSQKDVKYNWPSTDKEKNCDFNGKHAFHSMAIIGMRCSGDKIQYKIQNSWGNRCDLYSNEMRAGCDSRDGTLWVDENIIAENVTGLSLMTRGKAHYGESF